MERILRKTALAGMVLLLCACPNPVFPDYNPGRPEALRAEASGYTIKLYCQNASNTKLIEIYCKSPSASGFRYLQSEYAGNYPLVFTVTAPALAGMLDVPGYYVFQVRGRNDYGVSDFSPAASAYWEGKTGDGPASKYKPEKATLSESVWNETVKIILEPVEPYLSYKISLGQTVLYHGAAAGPITLQKGALGSAMGTLPLEPPLDLFLEVLTLAPDTTSFGVSFSVELPQTPGIVLRSVSADEYNVYLEHEPLPYYYPQGTRFELFCNGSPYASLLQSFDSGFTVPAGVLAEGENTFKVRARGGHETGGFSNILTLNMEAVPEL